MVGCEVNADAPYQIQAYRESQLQNQVLTKKVAEQHATQTSASQVACSKKKKMDEEANRSSDSAAPELEILDGKISKLGRLYAVLVSLWPLLSYTFLKGGRPDIDPNDPDQRYPPRLHGPAHTRSLEVQRALDRVVAAELYDFVGTLGVEFENKWVQRVVSCPMLIQMCYANTLFPVVVFEGREHAQESYD